MKRKRKTTRKKVRTKSRQRAKRVTLDQLTPEQLQQQVARTTTGELVQPTRLHYAVSEPTQTAQTLLSLECMDDDPERHRWVWVYTQEASRIPLEKHPKDGPVVIGEFFWKGDSELVLDMRSIERALAAVEFFDHHLPRTLAQLTHVTMINRLFSFAALLRYQSIHAMFEQLPLTEVNPDELVAELLTIKEHTRNPQERDAALAQIVENLTQRPEPEMEKFPVRYYEEGIDSLRLNLHTQQAVAVQHWQGNTAYTSYNAIQDILQQGR